MTQVETCSRSARRGRRSDETFLDIRLAHAERGHPRGELVFFFEADGKCAHAST